MRVCLVCAYMAAMPLSKYSHMNNKSITGMLVIRAKKPLHNKCKWIFAEIEGNSFGQLNITERKEWTTDNGD